MTQTSKDKNLVCKGSFSLGTACGKCEKCKKNAVKDQYGNIINGLSAGKTREELQTLGWLQKMGGCLDPSSNFYYGVSLPDYTPSHTSMKNRFEGPCCHCGETVLAGEDTFEKSNGKWKPLHLSCRPKFVDARNLKNWTLWSKGTGKRAQMARKHLRELELVQ